MSALRKLALIKNILGGSYDLPENPDEREFYIELIERCIKENVDPKLGLAADICIMHEMASEPRWKTVFERMVKKDASEK